MCRDSEGEIQVNVPIFVSDIAGDRGFAVVDPSGTVFPLSPDLQSVLAMAALRADARTVASFGGGVGYVLALGVAKEVNLPLSEVVADATKTRRVRFGEEDTVILCRR